MSTGPRRSTRRLLIGGGASALATAIVMRGVPLTLAQTDRGLLDLLFILEEVQIALYGAILATFDAAAFLSQGLPEAARAEIQSILDAERAHLVVLARPEGAPELPAIAADATILIGALEDAVVLENLATAAYAGVIPILGRERLIPELIGIHSVEARQAAVLSTLVGIDPFPAAIDVAVRPEEALARLEAMAQGGSVAATPVAPASAVAPMIAAIAEELGVTVDEIDVVSAEPRDWPDTSLGCPRPGEAYAEVITPGYLIVVDVAGERIEFHTDEQGTIVRCP
jgi:hypothetical protein